MLGISIINMWIVGIWALISGIDISMILIILTVVIIRISILISMAEGENEPSGKWYVILEYMLIGVFKVSNLLTFYVSLKRDYTKVLFESVLIRVLPNKRERKERRR